jgi:hypothetical protein
MVSFEGEARGDARKEKRREEEAKMAGLERRHRVCMCIYLYIVQCIPMNRMLYSVGILR